MQWLTRVIIQLLHILLLSCQNCTHGISIKAKSNCNSTAVASVKLFQILCSWCQWSIRYLRELRCQMIECAFHTRSREIPECPHMTGLFSFRTYIGKYICHKKNPTICNAKDANLHLSDVRNRKVSAVLHFIQISQYKERFLVILTNKTCFDTNTSDELNIKVGNISHLNIWNQQWSQTVFVRECNNIPLTANGLSHLNVRFYVQLDTHIVE